MSRPLLASSILAACLGAAAVSGAAAAQTAPAGAGSTPARAGGDVNDPFEATNRKIYGFNTVVDRKLLRPGVVFYHHATPTPVRHGLHNVLVNMTGPVIIINDALQLRPVRALTALGRFTVNSTIGVGGVFDVAGSDLPYRGSDFGLTLARYGVGGGPYIVLPFLGPSTVRDAVGHGADAVIDPFNSINYTGRTILTPVRGVAGAVDARDQIEPLLKDLDRTATDPYATVRSAYLQNRQAQVRGEPAAAANAQALPDFGPAPVAPTPAGRRGASPQGGEPDGPMAPPPPGSAPGPAASIAPDAPDQVADLLASLPSVRGVSAAGA